MVKDTAMIITVGTGIGGTQEATDSLAHGILFAISQSNPKKVILFGSQKSRGTVESLKRQYELEEGEDFDSISEYIEINEVDNFKKYFLPIKSKIQELEDNYKIIIDYTSGTKTMTMSAAFASMLYHKKLIFVTGERVDGIVRRGTEEIKSQNLYLVYDELMLSKIRELFNSNRFEAGKVLLDDVVGDSENKEAFTMLFDSYNAFDNVDYATARKNFDIQLFKQTWPELEKHFEMNAKALSILNVEKHGLKCYYVLASMLNNARRRFEEHKFDDAIARLYRSLELIAQIRLREYDVVTNDVDIGILRSKVSEDYLTELEVTRDRKSGKIRIGLTQDYVLLNELDDELGKFYIENEKSIQNSLKYRNQSILAHGMNSQNEEQYLEFRELVLKAAIVLKDDIEKYISETVFPEFEIN